MAKLRLDTLIQSPGNQLSTHRSPGTEHKLPESWLMPRALTTAWDNKVGYWGMWAPQYRETARTALQTPVCVNNHFHGYFNGYLFVTGVCTFQALIGLPCSVSSLWLWLILYGNCIEVNYHHFVIKINSLKVSRIRSHIVPEKTDGLLLQ